MIERLWSAWRASYVEDIGDELSSGSSAAAGDGSVFTRILRSGLPDDETHVVHRGTTCFVIANLFPYSSGHLLVVPYREVADLDGLTAEETTDLWATVADATRVLRTAYRPDGLNVGLNLGRPAGGSIPDHLHVHVVPRWTGDSNFMMAIGATQTVPESLERTTAKVRAAWDQP
ncbi:MAG: HIT domain-containing protein [Acidimicrobiia bacterium]|nr:HIT domain-containing protein [Acidimicrobiia bacterium]